MQLEHGLLHLGLSSQILEKVAMEERQIVDLGWHRLQSEMSNSMEGLGAILAPQEAVEADLLLVLVLLEPMVLMAESVPMGPVELLRLVVATEGMEKPEHQHFRVLFLAAEAAAATAFQTLPLAQAENSY
jgi:hypothetical protein